MPRRRGTPVAAALVALGLLAGCSSPGPVGIWTAHSPAVPSSSAQPSPETVQWRDCKQDMEALAGSSLSGTRADCATLRVPRDWAEPSGPTFDIALVRMRRTNQQNRIGSLLVNPGGPGASGIRLAAVTPLFLPTGVLRQFDIVGFDPRGVGRSSPVECIPDATLDATTAAEPDPVDAREFNRQATIWRGIGAACGAKYGATTLGLFSTEQTARDMDAIRQAVGDQKLTYLGYSYGTELGAAYARFFPTRIRALVLDGAVDPLLDSVTESENQAAGFEKAFDNFTADCRAKRCAMGPDARATLNRVLAKVRARPVPGKGGEKRVATAGYVLSAVVASLYSRESWSRLATAIAAVDAGDPTKVFRISDEWNDRGPDGRYTSNQADAILTINCADDAEPPTLADVRRLQGQWRTRYPLFGAPLALSMMGCSVWPGTHDPWTPGPAVGAPPIVVVGTVGDPATPYANTAKLANLLGTGVVVTYRGEGHTAYPQTACLREAVDEYLLRLAPPAEGTSCPA
ncbi:MAG TPA: alpha/beta hydrolase [Cryptosporangiaceae bacterium]|nr:alpha/beta hydrolase [Cryptosporangiaceae bacterium]